MQYLVIAIILMVLCVFGLSCRKSTPTDTRGGTPPTPIIVTSGKFLSRQDIQKQLAIIAKSPPPKKLAMGAMCYDIAGPPARLDYVCPVCGEKTLYAMDPAADDKTKMQYWTTAQNLRSLESCRRLVQQIKKIDIKLNESPFCKQCAPDIETPELGLIIIYPDVTKESYVSNITETDLLILKAFTEGKLKFKDLQDMEIALKDRLARLEELLGVKAVAPRDQYLSRQDIQKQLAIIAKSPPPKELAMGAMCYEMVAPLNRVDYVCPACGEKTLYAIDDSADDAASQRHWQVTWNLSELDACRRLVSQIDNLDMTLDESQFCNHCSPHTEVPKLGLVIRYPDQPEPHRVWDVSQTDLIMLDAAADGKLKYKGVTDNETALKDSLPRLEELLGVRINDANSQ